MQTVDSAFVKELRKLSAEKINDYMGMLATVINAMALMDAIRLAEGAGERNPHGGEAGP